MNSRYIPAESKEIRSEEANAVVYAYTDNQDRPCAIGYVRKVSKPDFHLIFRSKENRQGHINKFFDALIGWNKTRAEYRAAQKAYTHDLNPGDILHGSWGYEQTNCEFYQVISRTEKSVRIRQIAQTRVDGSEGFMSESRLPDPDNFIGEQITRRVRKSGYCNGEHEHVVVSKWDGSPRYASWYH